MKTVRTIVGIMALIIFFLGGCRKVSYIELYGDEYQYKYKIFLKEGFYFNDSNTIKFLLKFHRPDKLFTKDTGETIDIYIRAEQKTAETEVFFVRVCLIAYYGFMNIEAIDVKYKSDGNLVISGKMHGKPLSSERYKINKLSLSFTDIPLKKVNSMEELQQHIYDYHKEKLKEYFKKWER